MGKSETAQSRRRAAARLRQSTGLQSDGQNRAQSRAMNRRDMMRGGAAMAGLAIGGVMMSSARAEAAALNSKAMDALNDIRITAVRYFEWPWRTIPTQSANVVMVETNAGITGIGEGGTPELIRVLARMLIGKNPTNIDRLWNVMYRGHFYPPGREGNHALGALDMALWDIKGKLLGVPVWALLGGKARDYVECYTTGFDFREVPNKSDPNRARDAIEYGFRCFRTSLNDHRPGEPFNTNKALHDTAKKCEAIRKKIGPEADWCIDFHTRFDAPDGIRLANLITDLEPYFCEDMVRSEYPSVYKHVRNQVSVPIAVGEQFGDRWDVAELMEQDLIDYSRISLPNTAGITEYMKIAAIAETHYIGQCPHFTGPISTAALVHTNIGFSGPVLMEILGKDKEDMPHLPESFDLKRGKLYANDRPGLGVVFDPEHAKHVLDVTEYEEPLPVFSRDDGSFTNW